MTRSAEELVAAWQAGGEDREECFRQLYERHARKVAYFFANRGLPSEECRDLTQEAFVQVLRGLPTFRGEAKFATWIQRIVQSLWLNALRDRHRLKRKGHEVPIDFQEEGPLPVAAGASTVTRKDESPLGQVLVEERHRHLRRAMGALPKDEQTLVFLRVDKEMKYREIASTLRLPIGTVRSKLSRARRNLKEMLDSHYSDISF